MAGSSAPPADGKKKARIEIIPLIDVIFFLLATFVLFTLSLSKIVSLPVQLPVATPSAAPPNPNDDMVTLQVSDSGTCFWNRELITMAEITPRLEQYRKSSQNPRVLIAGDNKAKFGSTVYALDQVRKAGIDQVSVETRVRPTGQ
jgi:biopolymer transport protein ExbD